MAVDEFELIGRAVELTLSHAEAVQSDLERELETSAATPLVDGLRTLTMQSSIVAIGAFSVFESLLQQKKGWESPLSEVVRRLRAANEADLAERFLDIRNAINVLKHGDGASYDRLLARKANLPFAIKARGQSFFMEGDVSAVQRLVDADHNFTRQCAAILVEVIAVLRQTEDALKTDGDESVH